MLSRSHPLARRLRELRRDPARRAAEGVLVAEGIHLVQEALAAKIAIEAVVLSNRLGRTDEGRRLETRLRLASVPVHEASDATLDALQEARSPQPVLAIVKRIPSSLRDLARAAGPALVTVACGVQDPGNLGTLLRTTEAAGGTGLAASEGSADLTHPRTVRASMGAIFRLPAAAASLDEVLDHAVSARMRLVGADADATALYDAVDWSRPVVVLFGAEGAGLPDAARARLDDRVKIPMAAGVESLSVAAAAAVILFEAARHRRRDTSSAG